MKPNISWLTHNVATGGDLAYNYDTAIEQARAIKAMGVTHVFDGRIEADDKRLWDSLGVHYLRVGVDDAQDSHLPASYFDQAVEWAREAVDNGGKVFAHCHMGINRGPSAAAAILLDQGMKPLTVLKLILSKRPIAGIYYFMDAYDAHIRRSGQAPNRDRRANVARQWRALVRNPEQIAHVQRAIADGHADDSAQRWGLGYGINQCK